MSNTVPKGSGAHWFTSSYSAANTQCVAAASLADRRLVRDSKLGAASPVLSFTPDGWQAFTTHIKTTN